jgi:hypothetical protein
MFIRTFDKLIATIQAGRAADCARPCIGHSSQETR